MEGLILAPAEFVALLNQTLEAAYPLVIIEGELSEFRVSKNRWVYFNLQDEQASVKFFGTVYNLPGPLEDGLRLQVIGQPRLHPRFGFSVNIQSIAPIGEGSIKKAADLLRAKLEAEGLFAPERKRALPLVPRSIGLITAAGSAAYSDFIKILNERWGGVEVNFADVYVQGRQAPTQIVRAIEHFNELPALPEVLVITRGGGSLEDLAAFNDERVIRAVAASRIPTLVAVGHEIDISLAELAADQRASTPSNAAQLTVPSRQEAIAKLRGLERLLTDSLRQASADQRQTIERDREYLTSQVNLLLSNTANIIYQTRKLMGVFDPAAALKRGYAIISRGRDHIGSIKPVKLNDRLEIRLADGSLGAKVEEING
jgi:exodeoxyribonuclease VII large subunit